MKITPAKTPVRSGKSGAWFLALPLLVALGLSACSKESSNDPADGGEGPAVLERESRGRHVVWLDVDPAMGLPNSEVDDGLAMLQAFASPEMEIRGVSVVFGNTALENGVPVAEALVERFGPSGLKVSSGAASAAELGQETAAVTALAAALEREPMTVFALGPVTNVGSLLQLRPDLATRIERLIMVAARRVGQTFLVGEDGDEPLRDFNFELDPVAMQVLLDSEIELVFAPWEVSSKVWIRQADLDDLAETGERGAFVAAQVTTWIARWRESFDVDGFNPFDTLAIGWLTHPDQVETLGVDVWIAEAEDDTNPGETKPYLLVDPEADASAGDGRRAIYATTPTADFKTTLLERLAGQAAGVQ